MGLFDKFKQQSALNRLVEQQLYAFVYEEFQAEGSKPGLYAQALVEAKGDESKANAAYLKLRVQSLKDEYTVQQLIDQEYSKPIKKAAKTKKAFVAKPSVKKPEPPTKHEYLNYQYSLNMKTGEAIILFDPNKSEFDELIKGRKFSNSYELRIFLDQREKKRNKQFKK